MKQQTGARWIAKGEDYTMDKLDRSLQKTKVMTVPYGGTFSWGDCKGVSGRRVSQPETQQIKSLRCSGNVGLSKMDFSRLEERACQLGTLNWSALIND